MKTFKNYLLVIGFVLGGFYNAHAQTMMNKVYFEIMTRSSIFILSFLLYIPSVWAWDFCDPNEDGIMLYYNVVDKAEGSCEVAQKEDVVWNCKVLRIPEKVILNRGNRDFGDPDTMMTVTGIGYKAFYSLLSDPTSLFERVELPYGISNISDYAFYGCQYMSTLLFPDNNKWLHYIGEYAFAGSGLSEFTIPKTLVTLSPHAFDHSGLICVEFEEGNEHLTEIPDSCFYKSTLQEVKMCSSITNIATGAFQGCQSLSSVHFSPYLETIGDYAFAECGNLKSPELPYGLGIIGNYAFWQHQAWLNLEIPETIMDIGEYALCNKIKKSPARLSIQNLYVNKVTTPYCVSEKSLGDYQYDYTEKKYTRVITGTNLIVPLNCKEEYATTYPWDRFDTRYITERDLSGIKPATAKTSQPEDVFSLDGRRLAKTQKGLNIIRYKDGTAKKVVVK